MCGWVSLLGFSEAGSVRSKVCFPGFWTVYFGFLKKWNLLTDAETNFGETDVVLVAVLSLCYIILAINISWV